MTNWKIFGETKLDLGDEIICVDVDLDKEIVIVDGERLTEARAEQISEEIMEVVYKHYGMKFVPRKLGN
jgi:Cu2+-containing amine oxidase